MAALRLAALLLVLATCVSLVAADGHESDGAPRCPSKSSPLVTALTNDEPVVIDMQYAKYADNLDCAWTFTTAVASTPTCPHPVVEVLVAPVDLEAQYDKVSVADGDNVDSPTLGRLSGFHPASRGGTSGADDITFSSSGASLTLSLFSDQSGSFTSGYKGVVFTVRRACKTTQPRPSQCYSASTPLQYQAPARLISFTALDYRHHLDCW
jgi:hypothetical protein